MRFVVSAAVAALAFSAMPAQAAIYLVTGTGQGDGTLQIVRQPGEVSPFYPQRLQLSFSYYVDSENPGFGAGSPGISNTGTGIFFDRNFTGGAREVLNFSGLGSDLLAGGTGTGTASAAMFNDTRSFTLNNVSVTFSTQLVTDFTGNLGLRGFGAAAVPEPATWAMMIAGFGLIGLFTRRRVATVVAA